MEIKFRAKRVDFEKLHPVQHWAYGYYFIAPLTAENCNDVPVKDGHFFLSDGKIRHCIATEHGVVYEVLPETVGQFTGDIDLNKVEIYKDDIVRYGNEEGIVTAKVVWKTNEDEGLDIAGFYYEPIGIEEYPEDCDDAIFEVIGNTFDNPELLMKKNDN